jgi:hypothetical protein
VGGWVRRKVAQRVSTYLVPIIDVPITRAPSGDQRCETRAEQREGARWLTLLFAMRKVTIYAKDRPAMRKVTIYAKDRHGMV